MTPEPVRGEIWSFLPTVAGRDKPSALGADRVLVLSNSTANALLPTVFALPLVADAPPHARLGSRPIRGRSTVRVVSGGLSGQTGLSALAGGTDRRCD